MHVKKLDDFLVLEKIRILEDKVRTQYSILYKKRILPKEDMI